MKKSSIAILVTSLCFLGPYSHAKTEEELQREVQVGTTWGKTAVTLADLHPSDSMAHLALYVAEFKGGTAFLLRSMSNKFYMATNAHVMVDDSDRLTGDLAHYAADSTLACHRDDTPNTQIEKARFGLIGIEVECKQVIGIWPDLDFAIFEIAVPEGQVAVLKGRGVSLSESTPLRVGQPLTMFGYGHFLNPGKDQLALMRIQDQDCRAFSPSADTRFITDPDQFSPGKYKVWAFVLGCDVSWGDSGAPIFDRSTGRFAGIIFTGVYPKNPDFSLNPTFLNSAAETYNEAVWSHLNFGVPASKIIEKLQHDKGIWSKTPGFSAVRDLL